MYSCTLYFISGPGCWRQAKTGKRRMMRTSADHSFGPDFPFLVNYLHCNSKYSQKVIGTIINAEAMFLAPGCTLWITTTVYYPLTYRWHFCYFNYQLLICATYQKIVKRSPRIFRCVQPAVFTIRLLWQRFAQIFIKILQQLSGIISCLKRFTLIIRQLKYKS